MTARRPRTLADEVIDAFRIVIAGAVALAVVLIAAAAWFLAAAEPASVNAGHAVALSNDLHSAMLDEQSSLRGYVVTGDPTAYANYRAARTQVGDDLSALRRLGSVVSSVDRGALIAAMSTWQNGWVAAARDPATRSGLLNGSGHDELNPAKLAAFVRSGRAPFTESERAQAVVLKDAIASQTHARHVDVAVIAVVSALLLGVGLLVATSTVHRRRQLQDRIVGPVDELLSKVQAVGRGEFGVAPVIDAPAELMQLRDELVDMSGSLRLQQQALATRAEEAAASARRLKMVLGFAREVSESLTLSRTLSVVAAAARRFAEAPRARVWLVEDSPSSNPGRRLVLTHDSITGDAVPRATQSLGYGGLGQAAQTHRVCRCDGLSGESETTGQRATALAVPMLKGQRLIGVLEILLPAGVTEPKPEPLELLEAMAAQAATAIDAALMYALTESLSLSDPLTGLANRRQLESDLTLEIERAARYRRPLSFLMVDIDHFKSVNDTFGHAVGDAVLVEVAGLLAEQMRDVDTVYRYGGEEFAVLARETDVGGAHIVAERLRRVIEERYATTAAGDVAVTISVGVATDTDGSDTSASIVAAADAALYAAKHAGRNRVETSVRRADGPAISRVRIPM